MAKYRKKPIEIDAELYSSGMEDCWLHNGVAYSKDQMEKNQGVEGEFKPAIRTLEGPLAISAGDWIITGVNGERYPIKPDIFDKIYEAVEVAVKQEAIPKPPPKQAPKAKPKTTKKPSK